MMRDMTSGARPRFEPSLGIRVVNWQDRENPQAGGAEAHLHQVFGRLVAWGHSVTLLCSSFYLVGRSLDEVVNPRLRRT